VTLFLNIVSSFLFRMNTSLLAGAVYVAPCRGTDVAPSVTMQQENTLIHKRNLMALLTCSR
jgi:hypothetical protein